MFFDQLRKAESMQQQPCHGSQPHHQSEEVWGSLRVGGDGVTSAVSGHIRGLAQGGPGDASQAGASAEQGDGRDESETVRHLRQRLSVVFVRDYMQMLLSRAPNNRGPVNSRRNLPAKQFTYSSELEKIIEFIHHRFIYSVTLNL